VSVSSSGKKRLLIVDDEPANRDLLRRVLGREFEVIEAESAAAALEVVCAQHIDLMLCDQVMPGKTGSQLAREVAARWPLMVIMLLTGTEDAPEVVAVRTEGIVREVVGKPWSLPELRAAVARSIQGQAPLPRSE
jgi:two-component system, NtrC family, response regulator HupR/HoxA